MPTDNHARVADLAVERGRKRQAAAAAADATHHDMALAWLDSTAIGEHRAVFVSGAFHEPTSSGLWVEKSIQEAQVNVAVKFNGRKLCKRNSDYKQIVDHASAMVESADFFAKAPIGVTTPSGFYRIDATGKRCECVPLSLEHRQSFSLRWDPDFDAEPTRVCQLLADAFEGNHAEDQTDALWQLMGAILFGLLARQQLAALFLGRAGSGKTTIQRVIESGFPASAVCAVSPAVWGHEYNVASLAPPKRLNLVGELADDAPIPAAAFKNVTGQNLIEGRHPTHRPFYFVCQAAHLFAANVTPPTTDRSEGFWRRWRVWHFTNRVPEDRADPLLVEKILEEEMPAFLAYAFRGAERMCEAGRLRTTPAHDAVLAKWKAAANPVLQYLLDSEWVELDPDAVVVSTREAYASYRKWASDVGMRNPFGRNHFLELVDSTGATLGVARRKSNGIDIVAGVRLIDRGTHV